jgi:DNA-binding CsgD family transcriptional regulator
MKRQLSPSPPPSLVAYEIEPGKVLFIHPLRKLPAAALAGLSPAEAEVLALILDGHDNGSIADARKTSPRTTANQVASIFRKLGVASRAELAAKVSSLASDASSDDT